MTDIILDNVEQIIVPNPGKETGVWNALDELYFNEGHAIFAITHDMILDKRQELEGKRGDRSGLKGMISKWCKKNSINPYNDPNAAKKPSNRQAADPLQKITAGLYSQI